MNESQDDDIRRIRKWIGQVRHRINALGGVLDAYGTLLEERIQVRRAVREAGLPALDLALESAQEKAANGLPLLKDEPLACLEAPLRRSARGIMPAVAKAFPGLAGEMLRVLAGLEDGSCPPASMLEALIRQDDAYLSGLAQASLVRPQSLGFAVAEIGRPVLEEVGQDLAGRLHETGWLQGRCPVCGALPDLAVFRAAGQEGDYLKNYGGQRWLHCPRCAAQWRFRRHVCPNCANEDNETLRYYTGTAQGERADVCLRCGRYMVGLDVREFIEEPDLDVAALSMMPLDILVQNEGFAPLAATPWNRLD